MLVTIATMALEIDNLTGHDIIDALKGLGFGSVISEAREEPATLLNLETTNNPEFEKLLEAARLADRLHHKHRAMNGERHGAGGCYSHTYETCGEHHGHTMTCGGYPRVCSRRESGPEIDAIHEALSEFCRSCDGTRANCDSSRIKCCPDCTHR